MSESGARARVPRVNDDVRSRTYGRERSYHVPERVLDIRVLERRELAVPRRAPALPISTAREPELSSIAGRFA